MPTETFFNLTEEKRSRIIDVAIDEFAEKPYLSISIAEIVRRAVISRGSFYQYFENKKDLYLHLLSLGMAQKLTLVSQLKPAENSLKTFDYLRWMIQASVQFELQYPRLAKIAYRALVDEIPFSEEAEELTNQGGAYLFNELIAQGILHEDVAPWVNTDMAAFLLRTIYNQFGHYLVSRLKLTSTDISEGTFSVFQNETAQYLFSDLMDLLEAGMSRNPEIRKQYFSK
ncbi:MAG: TetR/AcrR family transcriptional regulator [Chloroflexota bacterium]